MRGVDAGGDGAAARYRWPGNIRELRNAVERAMLLAEGETPRPWRFPDRRRRRRRASATASSCPRDGIDLEQLERSLVVQALERTRLEPDQAAALLGLNRDQIRYRIEKFRLEKTASRMIPRLGPFPADSIRRVLGNSPALPRSARLCRTKPAKPHRQTVAPSGISVAQSFCEGS